MELNSGHKIKYLGEKEMAKLKSDFTGCGYQDLLRLSPGRWLYPRLYMKYADKLYNFEFKQSDVLVMTYPKCGTTWVQEVVWTMLNNPDLKHSKTHQPIMYRSPFLELDMFTDLAEDGLEGVMIKLLETTPDPRTIKTHLPLSLMPSSLLNTTKVVYVARNPKDVVTSYYHHCRITKLANYKSSLEQFVQYFVDDNGDIGDWQTKLTPPMEDKINKWIEDNLNEIGITFKFSN